MLRQCTPPPQLTPHSLYAAVSVGLDTDTIISVLNRLSKVRAAPALRPMPRGRTSSFARPRRQSRQPEAFSCRPCGSVALARRGTPTRGGVWLCVPRCPQVHLDDGLRSFIIAATKNYGKVRSRRRPLPLPSLTPLTWQHQHQHACGCWTRPRSEP